jgi:hypothetical protein
LTGRWAVFHQQDYDLSRQRYAEYNAQFDGLYVPLPDETRGLVRRLLAALRSIGRAREPRRSAAVEAHEARSGAVAE